MARAHGAAPIHAVLRSATGVTICDRRNSAVTSWPCLKIWLWLMTALKINEWHYVPRSPATFDPTLTPLDRKGSSSSSGERSRPANAEENRMSCCWHRRYLSSSAKREQLTHRRANRERNLGARSSFYHQNLWLKTVWMKRSDTEAKFIKQICWNSSLSQS